MTPSKATYTPITIAIARSLARALSGALESVLGVPASVSLFIAHSSGPSGNATEVAHHS